MGNEGGWGKSIGDRVEICTESSLVLKTESNSGKEVGRQTSGERFERKELGDTKY